MSLLRAWPKYTAQNLVNIQRDDVRAMEKNLSNLQKILAVGFSKINCVNIKKAILVIGDTGCGKSTLLSAMLNGSHSLELKNIQKEM